jgi:uncharacterized protein YaaN involved in tellurite resistance
MATEDHTDQQDENRPLPSSDNKEQSSGERREPAIPRGVNDEEVQELKKRSADLVNQLAKASGSEELSLIDSIASIGIQAQRSSGGDLDLLRTRVGDMLTQEGPSAKISGDLVELRMVLNEINPHELKKPNFIRRILSSIPFIDKFVPGLKVLEKIAIRYEPVSRQAGIIETRLREGRMMLTKDNIELRKLYEQVEKQQFPVQKNAYMGELIMQQLDRLLKNSDDQIKAERIRNILHDVSMRVQDLHTMQEVYVQFFVSIDMTRQNNTRLGQSVERTLSLATNVITVGLAIQAALSRQKRVLEATERTREFLGNVILSNAETIKQHTKDIGDVYNNPVVAIDKITQAHNELVEAMDIASRIKQEGIESARDNIAKLSQMSSELQKKVSGLSEAGEAEPQSVEA